MVTVERNMYFDSSMADSDHLKGEEEEILIEPVKTNPQSKHQLAHIAPTTPIPDKDQPQEHCICMVSHRIQDIIDGR